MEKEHYNLIFGFGQSCGCSSSLRRAGLQFLTFPGDWTGPLWHDASHPPLAHELQHRVETLCQGGPGFMEEKSFFAKGTVSNTGKAVYINAETRYIFNHDFPIGCDFPTEIQKVAAKYRKRYNRLLELFAKSERVLFVRMDIPGGDDPTSVEACRLARKRLNERFAPAKFDALLVSCDPTVPFERRRFEKVEEGLFRLTFDYLDRTNPLPLQPDTSLTSVALAEHFSVDDYRTAEEKRSFAKARRRKRLQRLKDKIVRHLGRLFGKGKK